MAGRLKTDLWKKAYLIEFLDESGAFLDAFTLSVPPESEKITFSPRKSETKTFGGLHVDDYGLDAVKISLSGSTVNRDLKRIYNPKWAGADKWMSGEQEIYYLRNLIRKYKTGDNLKKETRIMLYDLSKVAKGQGGAGGGVIKNYWRVFPGDFKIRRASDRPFAYKYSIEFTAVDHEEELSFSFGESESGWGWVTRAVNTVREKCDKIKEVLTENPVLGTLKNVKNRMDDVDANLRNLTGIVDIAGEAALSVTGDYTGVLEGITNSANSIIKIPRDTTQGALNLGNRVFNSAMNLAGSVESLSMEIKASIDDPKEYFFPAEMLEAYGMTAEEYKDSLKIILWDLEDAANDAGAASKSGGIPDPIEPQTDTETGDAGGGGEEGGAETPRRFVLSYGDTEATLNSTDTFESLAARYLGSPGMAVYIAAYNGAASIDELNPGGTIKIPVLTRSGRRLLNRIYARPEDRDNYGRDIRLDSEGNTAASASGDYLLTDGAGNLNQAILLRLRESVNRRVRLVSYGIRTNISDPAVGRAYIISSVDSTVSRDPRVESVDNIRFAGTGDGLDVTVNYTDINRNNGSAAGRA
jgi:hypothetical protein